MLQVYIFLLVHLGPNMVFVLHAVCCLISLIIQQLVVPETRGKSLEQIQLELQQPTSGREKDETGKVKVERIDIMGENTGT